MIVVVRSEHDTLMGTACMPSASLLQSAVALKSSVVSVAQLDENALILTVTCWMGSLVATKPVGAFST